MSNGSLINFDEVKSPIAEAFRTLRTNLQFLTANQNFKTLLITSACPGEGKSTTAANLAISFALTGKKVLLIDCDLRKPQQHNIFEVSNDEGLSNLLNQELYLERVIKKTSIPGVKLLPSGPLPINPAELLGSKNMEELVERLKAEDIDLIIFDTPPVVVVTDAAILATEMDGVVLVINAGETKIELVKKARELLAMVKANVVGVVLNKMDVNSQDYYYYYYNSDGKKKKKKKKNNAEITEEVNHG